MLFTFEIEFHSCVRVISGDALFINIDDQLDSKHIGVIRHKTNLHKQCL